MTAQSKAPTSELVFKVGYPIGTGCAGVTSLVFEKPWRKDHPLFFFYHLFSA